MDNFIPPEFDLDHRNRSDEALKNWRKAVGKLVKNRRRRFRYAADLEKRSEAKELRKKLSEKIRISFLALTAALRFLNGAHFKRTHPEPVEEEIEKDIQNGLPEEARLARFKIHPDKLGSLVASYDIKTLTKLKGIDGLADRLNVSLEKGVNSSDVPARQSIYGANRYTEKPSKGFWVFVWEALHDLTLIILIVCAVVSIGVGLATEGWPKGTYDGLGIILSILLVVMVTAISDYKQSLQFKELDKEKKKIFINVTRDGVRQKVSIYDLVVGDIVILSIGDQVPADGIFISGFNLLIDQSSLTGESVPINIYEKRPFLLAGTKVQDGSGKMLVTTVGMRTEWGKLMETLSECGDDETPLQVKLNGVATIIGKIGLCFAVLTFLVLTVRFLIEKGLRGEISQWGSSDALLLLNYFATAVTIIVVAVPEGLPLAVTLSLAFAMKQLMKEKALVRHLSACETMGSATCICTDKTGTLTTNHMVVSKIWLSGKSNEVDASGHKDALDSYISEQVFSVLLQGVFNNTGAEVVNDKDGKRSILGTPTESAILEYGLLLGDFKEQRKVCKILKVEPFNSEKKKMSVLVSLPDGKTRAFCKGASEIILKACSRVINADGEVVELSEEQVSSISDIINGFANEALRTLCLAFKDIDYGSPEDSIPESDYTLIAIVGIKDPVRPGVKEAVKTCLDAGIAVRMVTGDNINTAKAIARECGILKDGDLAIEGPEFRSLSINQMKELIPKLKVMARSSPTDKHTLVKTSRNELGEVVAVTGDGTNDAPAMHEADIGLAMGIAGTEVAKESADVIVLDDNFSTIVNVAKWGRSVYINIQKFVQFQLTVNIVALLINFISACVSGSAPLTAVQLLWVNLIMDTLGALALATELPNDGLMQRPPVQRNESFITRTMWRNIFGQSIYQLAILLVLNFIGKQILGLTGSNATEVLNTFIFNTFVFCQVFNEINSREIEKINIFHGLFGNWIFLGIIAATVVFQVIIVEFLGAFASTVPLNWQLWLISIALGSVGMPIAVVLKCIPVKNNMTVSQHDGYDALPTGPELA
ncbi:calcium-transporting ATPase 4, plasma membrane-type-like [Salvia splendens]|uniref:calcium-transporting ATPase 4, plasma membrane-type-like n=1 Tax=Salvia splendens TaxID=180675 RepID=UPI001C277A56|nr:calcium-transporting ATPase 4, plasma membrane-type-like [Salvia splendens]